MPLAFLRNVRITAKAAVLATNGALKLGSVRHKQDTVRSYVIAAEASRGFQNIYLIDGDGGLGFNHATIGGLIVHDFMRRSANPWARVFDPKR